MKIISLVIFIVVQIVFIPLFVVGAILAAINQLAVSKKLGVSGTAISAIAARWLLDAYGRRKDPEAVKLYRALPNGSEPGLWMLLFPGILRYRIYPVWEEEGKESIGNVAVARTILFDRLIDKSKDKAGQFVVMGAGYDTRCYGGLRNSDMKFFELDQAKTQGLKIKSLKKAGIDASHVVFVDVDFSSEKWYEKLEKAGYDPGKRSIFLWEGVTIYLSESDIRNTIKEIQGHSAKGSVLLADFYAERLTALRGVKATNENFGFGLDFFVDRENVLRAFLKSANVDLGDHYFIGHKTPKGAYGVVAEINL